MKNYFQTIRNGEKYVSPTFLTRASPAGGRSKFSDFEDWPEAIPDFSNSGPIAWVKRAVRSLIE